MTETWLQLHAGGQPDCCVLGHQQQRDWHIPAAALMAGLAVLFFLCSLDPA